MSVLRTSPSATAPAVPDLGSVLRAWRLSEGLNLRQAAERCGVTPCTVAGWESGRRPRDLSHRGLAAALEIGLHDLRQLLPALTSESEVRGGVTAGRPSPLTAARVARGLTMPQAAARLFVSTSTLSLWERGFHRPPATVLPNLARVLRLDEPAAAALFDGYPSRWAENARPLPSLARVRVRRGLTQRDLGTAIGVSDATVSGWERHGKPVLDSHVRALTAALGTTEGELAASVQPVPPSGCASRLVAVRQSARLTQQQAARRLGVGAGRLRAVELGSQTPPLWLLRRMSLLYDVPVGQLAHLTRVQPPLGLVRRRWQEEGLPAVVSALRAWSGMNTRQAAKAAQVAPETFRGWERGRARPDPARLERVLLAWGLSEDDRRGLLALREQ